MRSRLFWAPALALCILSSSAPAATWYIKDDGSGDAPSIQAGIDSATSGDTVLVAAGTYTGTGNYDIDFFGKAVTVLSESGPLVTVVDPGGVARGFILQSGEGAASKIIGLTIMNGNANSYADPFGGGIFCTNASAPIIRECLLYSNSANRGGGIGLRLGSNPAIQDCFFSDNTTVADGAGIDAYESSPLVDDCYFTLNVAGTSGAGILTHQSTAQIVGCEFIANTAGTGGGGIATWVLSDITVDNCTFDGNSALTDGGGGMYIRNSSGTIRNCDFSNHELLAGDGGAIKCMLGSSPDLIQCTMNDNVADLGGGIYCETGSNPDIRDCTIIDNNAGRGGGIACRLASNPVIRGCELLGNEALSNGGGIDAYESSPAIRNCIIANGTAGDHGGGVLCHDSNSLITGCVFSGNSVGNYGGGLSCWVNSTVTVQSCTFYANDAGILASEVHSRNSATTLENTIFAFGQGGGAVYCEAGGSVALSCSDIFGNVGGDFVDCAAGQDGVNGNFSVDPLFCNPWGGNFALHSDSPCADGNHPSGDPCGLIGAVAVWCGPSTSSEETSWGEVKRMFR